MLNRVISLPSEKNRRAHIQQVFQKQKICFDFYDALAPQAALEFAAQNKIKFSADKLTAGEIACFMSHVSLWIQFINSSENYIAIFEDDIHLGENAHYYLCDDEWIESENIIKLEAFAESSFLSNKNRKLSYGNRLIYELKGQNYGTAGYILSKQGAKKLLQYVKAREIQYPLDHLMFEHFIYENQLPVYQMNPALCIQDMMLNKNNQKLASALVNERHTRMKANKRKGWAKLALEVKRVFKKIQLFLFGKKILFK